MRGPFPRAQGAIVAAGLLVAGLGCNAVLGIHPALDQEWDGGLLGDGAPAVAPSGSAGSTAGGSTAFDAGPLPDAGAVTQWADWAMPNPPSIVPALPHPQSYEMADPSVVIDTVTHLQWQLTADGSPRTYADAVNYCAALQVSPSGGGWRMPSRIELMSILDNTQQPRINGQSFAMPVGDGGTTLMFWTSSLLASDPSHAWVVDFGMSTNLLITAQVQPTPMLPIPVTNYVRCVRGPS